jgi:hypothetical protein
MTYIPVRKVTHDERKLIYRWLRNYAPRALLAHEMVANNDLVGINFDNEEDAIAFKLKFGL